MTEKHVCVSYLKDSDYQTVSLTLVSDQALDYVESVSIFETWIRQAREEINLFAIQESQKRMKKK